MKKNFLKTLCSLILSVCEINLIKAFTYPLLLLQM